jgi:hypothetical protein
MCLFYRSYLLWFLLGYRLTGPFVIMIYTMVFGDILRFLIINSIVLIGFSQVRIGAVAGLTLMTKTLFYCRVCRRSLC